jgi:hypothetical protein
VSAAERQLRWSVAWWIGHGIVGVGVAVVAAAMFGKKAQVPGLLLGIVMHHALDTPVAAELYKRGV